MDTIKSMLTGHFERYHVLCATAPSSTCADGHAAERPPSAPFFQAVKLAGMVPEIAVNCEQACESATYAVEKL